MFSSLFKSKTDQRIQSMSSSDLHQKLQEENELYLIDVRSPQEYATGHIEGARLLPLQNIQQRLREIPQHAQIVCICLSGTRSGVASEILAKAGYSSIYNLSGGMTSWIRHDYQIVR